MNNKVVLKIVIICVAVFIFFGILTTIFALGTSSEQWKSERNLSFVKGEPFEYHKTDEFDLDGITQINIDTVSTDVIFYKSDSDLEITLDCEGYTNNETITLKTEKLSSTINAKIKYPKVFFGFNITKSLLKVGIPESYCESIDINGVSSKILLDGIPDNTFKKVDIDTVSGNAYVDCVSIDILKFNSTSGDLEVTDTTINNITADTTSGDIIVTNIISEDGKVNVDSVSGKIELFYKALCETKVSTTSGDVYLNIPADSKIDLDFDSVSGDIKGDYNKNSDGVYINVDTVSGDLTIR